ncbi:MAG: hypothetical protein G01um10148_1049 [Parcubacteria group bacterium Gr01-1014_8]|nr:MAG: hypothetical protein G01um10148_1049 [Parcubacteria group bacterium Gr01-1014_8]
MTSEIANYLDSRLSSLEKQMGSDTSGARCEVEISRAAGKKHSSDYMWTAEVRIIILGKKAAYAKNSAASVNAAIDDVKEEIERQLRKSKGKSTKESRRKGKRFKDAIRGGK